MAYKWSLLTTYDTWDDPPGGANKSIGKTPKKNQPPPRSPCPGSRTGKPNGANLNRGARLAAGITI